jgi:hypothetical protein
VRGLQLAEQLSERDARPDVDERSEPRLADALELRRRQGAVRRHADRPAFEPGAEALGREQHRHQRAAGEYLARMHEVDGPG